MALITALTLLHVLVFVYWLGGDLGAFYGSNFLRDPSRSVPERMMALKILANIDMAPRTALILALPTGFALAAAKGWLEVPGWIVALVLVASLAWLAVAWMVHLKHGGADGYRKVDMAIRYGAMIGMLVCGLAGITGALALPFFIACKLIVLGLCIGLGLIVRMQLGPLFPAARTMAATGATPETDRAITAVLLQTRKVVLCLWALLLVAAWLGISTPA